MDVVKTVLIMINKLLNKGKETMEKKYTSPELSRKLVEAGCELKGSKIYEIITWSDGDVSQYLRDYGNDLSEYDTIKKIEIVPAYDILNDICVKYCRDFFGEELGDTKSKYVPMCLDDILRNKSMNKKEDLFEKEYESYSKRILELLQQGKKQEVEDYIWKHTVFNKENKEV